MEPNCKRWEGVGAKYAPSNGYHFGIRIGRRTVESTRRGIGHLASQESRAGIIRWAPWTSKTPSILHGDTRNDILKVTKTR